MCSVVRERRGRRAHMDDGGPCRNRGRGAKGDQQSDQNMPRFHDETSKLHASKMGERPASSTAPYASLILPGTLRLPSVRIAKCSNLPSVRIWQVLVWQVLESVPPPVQEPEATFGIAMVGGF